MNKLFNRLVVRSSRREFSSFVESIGNTPLIKLQRISDECGCNILAKAEFLNPGGSVKDRAAKYLTSWAVKEKNLKPGGTIVEGTAGNTGIGLAHVALSMGLKCRIYMPNNQSPEKVKTLLLLGAKVIQVPPKPFTDPANYNHQAKNYADSHENCVWTNQFDNTANRFGHYDSTGPEIWRQTNQRVDGVIFGAGTGGTASGVAEFLKEKNSKIVTAIADPEGSALYKFFTTGTLGRTGEGSITEGIGQGRITDNVKDAPIDTSLHITDVEAMKYTLDLLHKDGFCVGATSGLNVVAAVKLAQQIGKGSTVVTALCDTGHKYAEKIYSKAVLKQRNLLQYLPEEYLEKLQ
ncbi:hypothetical protein SNEBB_001903 [Seison nebaliae]|nr:hypothetical protein SNEBB_001903 [Seison nebaliae]